MRTDCRRALHLIEEQNSWLRNPRIVFKYDYNTFRMVFHNLQPFASCSFESLGSHHICGKRLRRRRRQSRRTNNILRVYDMRSMNFWPSWSQSDFQSSTFPLFSSQCYCHCDVALRWWNKSHLNHLNHPKSESINRFVDAHSSQMIFTT